MNNWRRNLLTKKAEKASKEAKMEKKKLWIHISLFVILLIVTHGCVSVSRHSIVISRGFDYDSTYCIINDCNKYDKKATPEAARGH